MIRRQLFEVCKSLNILWKAYLLCSSSKICFVSRLNVKLYYLNYLYFLPTELSLFAVFFKLMLDIHCWFHWYLNPKQMNSLKRSEEIKKCGGRNYIILGTWNIMQSSRDWRLIRFLQRWFFTDCIFCRCVRGIYRIFIYSVYHGW